MASEWVAAVDSRTGKTYYANLKTRETRWTPPPEFKPVAKLNPTPVAPKENTQKTPAAQPVKAQGKWKESVDPKTGKTYYYHTFTRERQWRRPAEMDEEPILKQTPVEQAKVPSPIPQATRPIPTSKPPTTGSPPVKKAVPPTTQPPQPKKPITDDKFLFSINETEVIEVPNSKETNPSNLLSNQIKTQVMSFKLENFARIYYRNFKKGMMGTESLSETLSHTSKGLRNSLLKKLSLEYSQEAIQCFRNITGYMGDRKSGKPGPGHAWKLIKNAIIAPEDFHDEVYCQICKQTTNNPSKASNLKGWQLFALCVGCFPPSEEFGMYLASYFHTNEQGDDREIGSLASFCLKRLDRTMIDGSRKMPPTADELSSIEQKEPITIRIMLLDNSFVTLSIDSQTNAKDITKLLAQRFLIENESSFGLVETTTIVTSTTGGGEKNERTLQDEERVLDVLSACESKTHKTAFEVKDDIVFRVKLFLSKEEASLPPQALHMYYIQAVHNVISGNYPCNEKDSMSLAALQCQAHFGNNDSDFYHPGLISDQLAKFVPDSVLSKRDPPYIEAKILQEHKLSNLTTLTKLDAMKNYLDYVRKWSIYGATFFKTIQISRSEQKDSENVIVAISEKGLNILDPVSRQEMKSYQLAEILTYGYKDRSFLLVAGNLVQQKKLNFQVDQGQGREMNDLLLTYITKMVEFIGN